MSFCLFGLNGFAEQGRICSNFSASDNASKITFANPLSNDAFKDAFLRLSTVVTQKSNRPDIVVDRDSVVIHGACLIGLVGGECGDKHRAIQFTAHDRNGNKYSGEATLYIIYDKHTGQLEKYSFPREVTCPGAVSSNCHQVDNLSFLIFDSSNVVIAPCAGADAVVYSPNYN